MGLKKPSDGGSPLKLLHLQTKIVCVHNDKLITVVTVLFRVFFIEFKG